MKDFIRLVEKLDLTNKTSAKIQALVDFFQEADEEDKLWVIAFFTGKRPKRLVASNLMKSWAMELANIPEWLFIESYSHVGDLGETIALLLPPPKYESEKKLSSWMSEILSHFKSSEAEKKEFILSAWDSMDVMGRFIFNKLIGGSFRVGVSNKLLIQVLAQYSGAEVNLLMHSIMGKWTVADTDFKNLISGENINPDNSKPYPFCLAYALDKSLEDLGQVQDWQAEYKWDGIRCQLIKRNEEIFLWSRGEELINEQFPELVEAMRSFENDIVFDGELLVVKDSQVLNFNELQKRLNRKSISPKLIKDVPIQIYAYDILEWKGMDVREKSLEIRRRILEDAIKEASSQFFHLSPIVPFTHWKELSKKREEAREFNSEGLMLKSKTSVYHSGRKRGDWWKWKVEPLTMDAVLIYAQKGSGRRSQYFTDFTFAVRDGEKLVTLAKAYSGLSDKEIVEVNRFIKANSTEKFGPVRTVKPELVFEIAFEGIGWSSRHKSGVAVRFPRIARWRKDKTVAEIDTLEEIKKLIN